LFKEKCATGFRGYGLLESTLLSPNQAMELAGLARAAFLSEPNQLPREPLSVKVGAHEQALSHHICASCITKSPGCCGNSEMSG
jgi:hypothetical protein